MKHLHEKVLNSIFGRVVIHLSIQSLYWIIMEPILLQSWQQFFFLILKMYKLKGEQKKSWFHFFVSHYWQHCYSPLVWVSWENKTFSTKPVKLTIRLFSGDSRDTAGFQTIWRLKILHLGGFRPNTFPHLPPIAGHISFQFKKGQR